MAAITVLAPRQDVICGHRLIIRPERGSSSELCDTQIRCTDEEGAGRQPTFDCERAGAVAAD